MYILPISCLPPRSVVFSEPNVVLCELQNTERLFSHKIQAMQGWSYPVITSHTTNGYNSPAIAFRPVAPPLVPNWAAAGSSAGSRRSQMFRPRRGGSGVLGSSPCHPLQLPLKECLLPNVLLPPRPQPVARLLCLFSQILHRFPQT